LVLAAILNLSFATEPSKYPQPHSMLRSSSKNACNKIIAIKAEATDNQQASFLGDWLGGAKNFNRRVRI
jgi:hypothetical protein